MNTRIQTFVNFAGLDNLKTWNFSLYCRHFIQRFKQNRPTRIILRLIKRLTFSSHSILRHRVTQTLSVPSRYSCAQLVDHTPKNSALGGRETLELPWARSLGDAVILWCVILFTMEQDKFWIWRSSCTFANNKYHSAVASMFRVFLIQESDLHFLHVKQG